MTEPTTEPPGDEEDESNPLMTLLIGLGLIAFAAFLFWMFTGLESDGGRRRIPALLAIAYRLGGKWLPTVLVGGIGVLATGLGIKGLVSKR